MTIASDIAFTPSVKAVQAAKGSRALFAAMEASGGWSATITPELTAFIATQRSFLLATASAEGQPYIQHRGGPAGFLRPLDAHRLAFADFAGNRQYITLGNLAENPRAHILLIDYMHRRRIKLWGTATVVEDDPDLLVSLTPAGYRARPQRVIVFNLATWDANCPQHIPQRFEAEDVAAALESRDARIAELEAELARLRGG